MFDTKSRCWPTDVRVRKGVRYRVTMRVTEDWLDLNIPTSPQGFAANRLSWYLRPSVLLRRSLSGKRRGIVSIALRSPAMLSTIPRPASAPFAAPPVPLLALRRAVRLDAVVRQAGPPKSRLCTTSITETQITMPADASCGGQPCLARSRTHFSARSHRFRR